MNRPNENEFAPYYKRYIDLVPDGDIISIMIEQQKDVEDILSSIDEETSKFRYAENKWSVREVIGHVIDGERIFAYRALRFSRNDKTELPGFNQDNFMLNSIYHNVPIKNLLEEFILLRKANILMLQSFTEEMWNRTGIANNNFATVKAIAYLSVGHCKHHLNVLKEKYRL